MRKTLLIAAIAAVTAALGIMALACGDDDGTSVVVLGIWGEEEIDDFNAMVDPWKSDTGNGVDFTGTRDVNAVLTTRVEGGDPPDVAIVANSGIFFDLARAGELTSLSSCPGLEDQVRASYPESLIGAGSVDGTLFGIFMKAGNKGTIWYSPPAFQEFTYETPGTWDEMIALSDQITADRAAGTHDAFAWSDAEEIGGGSGFPGSDWVQQIVLNQWGPDVYDQWVAHEIPYNDDRIKQSWEFLGDILLNPDYVLGGADRALATTFSEGSLPLFSDPPQAFMHYLGSFNSGFITDASLGFPEGLAPGEDFDFFPFPTIDPAFAGGITFDGNILMIFNADEATCAFAAWLASGEAQQIWVERGGFVSLNTDVPLDSYPTDLDRRVAEQLSDPERIFRFDADDGMPAGVGGDNGAVFTGVLQYLGGGDLDEILQSIEDTFP